MNKQISGFCVALGLCLAAASPAHAVEDYPARPIRMIVAYPPGGSTDTAARLLAERLGAAMKQAVLVENRPGAGGVIGANFVSKAAPDGYTLLFAASPELSIAGLTNKDLPYNPKKDFAPISMVGQVPFLLVANNDFPATDVKSLISYAKANPGKVNFSSFGNNTSNHLGGELFNVLTGIKMTHIPYRGSSPSLTDLMGGQVQVTFDTITAVLPLVRAGKIRALAVATPARSPLVPDLPTIAESGVPGFAAGTWFGVLAPAGTPPAIVDKLSVAMGQILRSDDIGKQFSSRGIDPMASTPEELGTFVNQEIQKWTDVASKIGIKAE